MEDPVDVKDIEDFINGLQDSFDSLESASDDQAQGFQMKLAQAISSLRLKKISKIDTPPDRIGKMSREELKNYFLDKLELLRNLIDSDEVNRHRRFTLLMKMAKLREKIMML